MLTHTADVTWSCKMICTEWKSKIIYDMRKIFVFLIILRKWFTSISRKHFQEPKLGFTTFLTCDVITSWNKTTQKGCVTHVQSTYYIHLVIAWETKDEIRSENTLSRFQDGYLLNTFDYHFYKIFLPQRVSFIFTSH